MAGGKLKGFGGNWVKDASGNWVRPSTTAASPSASSVGRMGARGTRSPNMTSLKDSRFSNYFARGNQYTFHSSSRNAKFGWATSTGRNMSSLKGKAELSSKYGPQYNGATLIRGHQLVAHFEKLAQRFDAQLWLFVQAMGSHSLRFFQNTFSEREKRFNGGFGAMKKWRDLRPSTIEKRKRLGLWQRGTRRNILTATNRLVNSLVMATNKGAFHGSAMIETDPKAFVAPYPEKFINGKRGGDRRSKKFKSSHREGEIRNVSSALLTGRKGHCYAGYHNDRSHPEMFRQFMGTTSALMSPKERELMDRFLFYGLFNSYLGTPRNNIVYNSI